MAVRWLCVLLLRSIAVLHTLMCPVVTDQVSVSLSVGLSVTVVSPAKVDELIKMMLG